MGIIEKIIYKIPKDKKDHILLGILFGFPLVLFFGFYGGLISLGLVVAKEIIHDKLMKKGNPEFLDFVYSAIPIIMFMILNN